MNAAKARVQDRTVFNYLNIPAVLEYFRPSEASGLTPEESWRRVVEGDAITRDNRANFELAFGPPHQHFIGQHRHKVWRLEHESLVFWVFASVRGTSIDIEGELPDDRINGWPSGFEATVLSFLDTLKARMLEVEPCQIPSEARPFLPLK